MDEEMNTTEEPDTVYTSRVGAMRVQHYTGARPTRVTFRGVAEMSDGSRVKCPHDGHRTVEAAASCARAHFGQDVLGDAVKLEEVRS